MSATQDSIFTQIEATRSLSGLWALLVARFRAAGFGSLAYILFDHGKASEVAALLEYGFPPEVVSTYAALGYGSNDATLRVALTSGRATLRSIAVEGQKMTRAETWHRNVMSGLGMGEVLALPLYGPDGRNALGALANASSPALYEPERLTKFHMIAQAAHLRAFRLRPVKAVRRHGLSLREVEILRWVAQGKSNGVIAEILAISTGTVDTYLKRVFEKLNVTDRTSAAVRGVSLGLIQV